MRKLFYVQSLLNQFLARIFQLELFLAIYLSLLKKKVFFTGTYETKI